VKTIQRIALVLSALLLAAPAALAQKDKQPFLVPIPERLERATVDDADGLKQWAEHAAERCINCKGLKTMPCLHCERFNEGVCEDCPECHNEKKAVCRICAGTGEMPDILEKAPCPTCFGAAITRCFSCGGVGRYKIEGGGDRFTKCGSCSGVGAYPCGTCKGARFVETPKLKPSMKEAGSKDLLKAIELIEQLMVGVEGFTSAGQARDDIKALAKVLKPAARTFPALRSADQHFESVTKDQTKGSMFKSYEESVVASAEAAKQSLAYYLKHQKRVLELCLARAEHNEGMKK
jgi:hypothetical protein